jgi:glycosyltransferase involved in cell wall biosynthesis
VNSELRTVLIFEPLSGGHRANFIKWLRDAAVDYADCRFVFFTSGDAGDLQLENLGWWRKQKKLYDLFRQACKIHNPDHALILELTHLELPLALSGSPVPLSAILFVQYPELSSVWKNKGVQAQPAWKKVSKHWKTRLLLRRTPIKNLFLLNGEKSCRFLSEHFPARCRFIPIADPAPNVPADPGFSLNVPRGRRACLFFGAVSRRKGAHLLLETLAKISPTAAKRNVFLFCGEPEADYRAEFKKACARLRAARPDLDLIVETRFVSDGQMMAMFEQADLILLPYTRSEYSSGILALAAKAGTPVLGPKGGLLGRLIIENGLGLAADLTPETLELPVGLNETLRQKFIARNTIENFTKPILDAICHEG